MKKFAKISFALLLLLVVAGVGLTIYVKVKYPSERLRQLLIAYLANEYKLRVTVARLDFNLFSGFVLEDVAILGATSDPVPAPAEPPLKVEKIKFAYRWRSLLSRRLDIDEITIARPAFFYRLNSDRSSNLDAILANFADSTQTPSDTTTAGLPIDIHLRTFVLQNLQGRAVFVSTLDSQEVAFGPIRLAVNEIVVDRQANFSGRMNLRADSAPVHYAKSSMNEGDSLALATMLSANIASALRGDSLGIHGELALNQTRISLGGANHFTLPAIGTTAEVRYQLESAQLEAPEVRLLIDGKEQMAARFTMTPQNGVSTFALRLKRGEIDLAHLLALARTHTSGEIRAFLQTLDGAGVLEFSGSELANDQHGMTYQIVLRGRDLAYHDHASGLEFDGGQLQLDWKTNADSSAETTARLTLAAFAVPLDTTQVLPTGPVDLNFNLALAKDFFPQQGSLDLRWQNFSAGKIAAHVDFSPSNVPAKSGSWLSRLFGRATINVDALEISPFTAGAAGGKISSQLTLAGKRLDDAELNFALQNQNIRYETIDYKGNLSDYHLSVSTRFAINPALTKIALAGGKFQIEPAQASFDATYDLQADTMRINLPDLHVDLAQLMRALPDTILASMNYAKIQGRGNGSGWLQTRMIAPDSLDYNGVFTVHSEDAAYADSVLGIYTDSLQINSEWVLTAAQTAGTYTVACSTPKLPDYLRQPLPPTQAAGRLTVGETTFTIDDGKFEIPQWNTTGRYRVDGEFRPAGIQVKTTVDLDLQAPNPINLDRSTSLRGELAGQFIIDQYIPDALTEPQPSRVEGWLRSDGLDIKIDTTLALQGLRADCRFQQDFDLLNLPLDDHPPITFGMALEPEEPYQPVLILKSSPASASPKFASADEALLMYDLLREPARNDAVARSHLTIAEINLSGIRLTNLVADLSLGNSRFDIPRLSVNLFDGNVVGNLLVGLGNGNPDSISYATDMQISSLDVSGFRRLSAQLGGKQSRISANFALSGLGTAPDKLEELVNNLSGRLNITKIENKVASNLLQMLDPNGTDKGIQNIRLLMKTRWNVKELAFEIKNGFVYASLSHIKPWYAPFTLPQPFDFARLPVKPYLKTATNE